MFLNFAEQGIISPENVGSNSWPNAHTIVQISLTPFCMTETSIQDLLKAVQHNLIEHSHEAHISIEH
jgi:hypothetical protein